MLDIRVRLVMGRLVVSFWCNSHGGPPHCLWSGSQSAAGGGPADFAALVASASYTFAEKVERLQLEDLNSECLT